VALRANGHVENARRSQTSCAAIRASPWVNYAGFPGRPITRWSQKFSTANASSLFTFGIKGGMGPAKPLMTALSWITAAGQYSQTTITRSGPAHPGLDHGEPPDVTL